MAWIAVYQRDDGALYSVASDASLVADPLPDHLAAKEIDGDPAGLVWNATALAFEPPPPPDLSQMVVDTDVILHALGPALRIKLRANQDPRVQDFAYCLGAMNTVLASEAAAALQLILTLGQVTQAEYDALRAAIIPG